MNPSQKLSESLLYHIYPLGACGAPLQRDPQSAPCERLLTLTHYLPHLQALGVNLLYLGPVFESDRHGYDTRTYFEVDSRLGTNQTLKTVVQQFQVQGIDLIFDAVFNHVGRGFWAFQKLLEQGEHSPYRDWFKGVNFSEQSPFGDPFTYTPWEGHYELVTLNTAHLEVRQHLLAAVRFWIEEFGIVGLRLDAADCVDPEFWRFLRREITQEHSDFVLLGEIIHGDYRQWANAELFHSTTNYVAYKGIWSSLNDANYFEIAYTLRQQFGSSGRYRGIPLYNFVDNHDVNRLASQLENPAWLPLAYGMLFTIPGFPSLYYGSEVGLQGRRDDRSDHDLRPFFDPSAGQETWNQPLWQLIQQLATIRRKSHALQHGDYQEVYLAAQQFAYLRTSDQETMLVLLNASQQEAQLPLPAELQTGQAIDVLEDGKRVSLAGKTTLSVPKNCLRILQLQKD